MAAARLKIRSETRYCDHPKSGNVLYLSYVIGKNTSTRVLDGANWKIIRDRRLGP